MFLSLYILFVDLYLEFNPPNIYISLLFFPFTILCEAKAGNPALTKFAHLSIKTKYTKI